MPSDIYTVYYPTEIGIAYLHRSHTDHPSILGAERFGDQDWITDSEGGRERLGDSSSSIYALEQLMSKPWTRDDYMWEMNSQDIGVAISGRLWDQAKKFRFITSNPTENPYN